MTGRRVRAAALGILALAAAASPALAGGPGRAGLPAPPHQMLQALLHYADQGVFDRLEKGVAYLEPLLADLRGHRPEDTGEAIRWAAARRDRAAARGAILRVAFLDMKHELQTAADPATPQPRRLVSLRLAYLDFALLAPRLPAAAALERRFRALYERLRERTPEPAVEPALRQMAGDLDRECSAAFPEWRPS